MKLNPLKSAMLVSFLTLLSRITGMIRETLFASMFGAGATTDAFLAAFRLPNLFRRLFAEGAFSQAFLPILVHQKEEVGEMAAKKLIHHTSTVLFWVLLWFSLLGVLLSPILLYGIASGLKHNEAVFQEGVWMTRVMFPYIFFMSLVAFSGAILNAWRKFKVPAFTPIILNMVFIAGVFISAHFFKGSLRVLAVSVFIAGLLQLLFQAPALYRLGLLPHLMRFKTSIKNLGVRHILKNMLPGLFGVSIAQISLIINTQIASHLQAGSMTWLSYADRLMELPTALIGVALSTVLLPFLSKASTRSDETEFHRLMEWGLNISLILVLPCTVIFLLLSEPIVAILFHYGRFSTLDLNMTQTALQAYGVGLLGLILVKVFAPACYAKKDTKTPVKVGVCVLLLTQLLNFAFVPYFGHAGLALSISVGALCNALALFIILTRRGQIKLSAPFFKQVRRALLALAVAALLAFAFSYIEWSGWKAVPVLRLLAVGGILSLVGGVYVALLFWQGFRLRDFKYRETRA